MSEPQDYPDNETEDQLNDNRPLSPEEQRERLRCLILQGKERGYITYAEINDALPDDMSDAEHIDGVVNMIQGLGIQVTEEAPDADTLLMSDNSSAMTDEDAVAEAEAALSQADSEFGRTTDPVRMYMREMGQVELLTREDEIKIAKEIENALKNMIQAISACPGSVGEILALIDQVKKDEIRVDEVVEAIIDPTKCCSTNWAWGIWKTTARTRQKKAMAAKMTKTAAKTTKMPIPAAWKASKIWKSSKHRCWRISNTSKKATA